MKRRMAIVGFALILELPLVACGATQPAVSTQPSAAARDGGADQAKSGDAVVPQTRASIVACANDGTLFYLDPADGSISKEIPGPGVAYSSEDFHGTDLDPPGIGSFPSCGNGTYNRSLTQIAGVHQEGDERVPAVYDLASGEFRDIVPMSDRSGFGSSPIRYTAGVEFSPYADDLWYIVTVIGDGNSGMPSLVGPDYSEVYEFGGASGGNCDFIFRSPASLPAVICENYGEAIIDGSVQRASRIFDPHTVDPAALPENNRNIGTITVADDGVGAAFIEHEFAGGGVNRVLWVMSAAGADPVRVGLVDERIANVVRVGQFTF